MPDWSKKDTTKATPYKMGYEGRDYSSMPKKDVEFEHNIYGLVGNNLLKAFEKGKLTRKQLDDMLKQISLEARVDLGKGYGVDLGYNPSGERWQSRIKITKDIF